MRIAFVGTVNAMPMAYAKYFRDHGYDVKYIVDVPRGNLLSRPESHYKDITYPYPDWIEEVVIKRPSLGAMVPAIAFQSIINKVKGYDVVFLCDWYIAIAPYLAKDCKVIILPHGADLDVWCNPKKLKSVAKVGALSQYWYLKILLAWCVVRRMRKGLDRADLITYFPKGLNPDGDSIIDEYERKSIPVIRRYDISLSAFDDVGKPKNSDDHYLKIISPVRFDYLEVEGVENKYLKGNDLIIKAIARYYHEVSKMISVTFFNKGQDLQAAKQMCTTLGINEVITWVDPVPAKQLLDMMNSSDICFDQVGRHWVGAVGVFALYLGKPLIANYQPHIMDGYFEGACPIGQAATEEEVFQQMVRLSCPAVRKETGSLGVPFVKNNFDSAVVAKKYIGYFNRWGLLS